MISYTHAFLVGEIPNLVNYTGLEVKEDGPIMKG